MGDVSYISEDAFLGDDVVCWEGTKIREYAVIGDRTKIGRMVYIDHHVHIGQECKIQNHVQIYYPATLGSGVFMGPLSQIINDKEPRARGEDGGLMSEDEWQAVMPGHRTLIGDDASIGAGAIIFPGVHIGARAMIGANVVVRCDVEKGVTYTG